MRSLLQQESEHFNQSSKVANFQNTEQQQLQKLKETNDHSKKLQSRLTVYSEAYPAQIIQQAAKIINHSQQPTKNKDQYLQNPKIKGNRPKVELKINSDVHWKLQSINFKAQEHSELITIRQATLGDIPELKKLQQQWFPVRYDDSFYQKILNRRAYCLIAETKIKIPLVDRNQLFDKDLNLIEIDDEESQNETATTNMDKKTTSSNSETLFKTQTIIVGAVVFNITSSQGYLEESLLKTCCSLLSHRTDALYIMTIGVINEFRKKGIGKLFIDELFSITEDNKNIKLVFLHVIDYNRAAIKFYEKLQFSRLDRLSQYYHIQEKQYDGLVYGKAVNQAELSKKGWVSRLQRYFLKS